MPNKYARLNLATAIFPFYTAAAGRTIMLPELDENFDRYNAANTTPDKGVPQVFYMHNCFPISGGFQSIGYLPQLTGLSGVNNFDSPFYLTNSQDNSALFVPAVGLNYIFDGSVGTWQSISPITPGLINFNSLVTTAYVKGTTYVFYETYGCFTYNATTRVFDPVILTGLDITQIIGIFSANGYMLAWTSDSVVYSSLSDPTNFIPSIQTGAGGGKILDVKGSINICLPVSGGFLIYCEKNIVGAAYSGNVYYPYIYLEVKGSGGVDTIDKIAYQSNLPYHVAMTTAGIQQVSIDSAIHTLPELSDFLTGKIFEDFDETTLTFSEQYLTRQLNIKFSYVSDRFFVCSYGVSAPDFTHAVVYDLALNRFGKVKIPHRSAFSYGVPTPFGELTYAQLQSTSVNDLRGSSYYDLFSGAHLLITPKQNLAFLQEDGTVQLVDFSLGESVASGVFILGKFQFSRSSVIVHQRTDIETVNRNNTFSLYILPSYDGKDFGPAVSTTTNATNDLTRTFARRITATNISLLAVGAFDATSIVINFTLGGIR